MGATLLYGCINYLNVVVIFIIVVSYSLDTHDNEHFSTTMELLDLDKEVNIKQGMVCKSWT